MSHMPLDPLMHRHPQDNNTIQQMVCFSPRTYLHSLITAASSTVRIRVTLGFVLWTVGLDQWIRTCVHCDGLTRSTFIAPKARAFLFPKSP